MENSTGSGPAAMLRLFAGIYFLLSIIGAIYLATDGLTVEKAGVSMAMFIQGGLIFSFAMCIASMTDRPTK